MNSQLDVDTLDSALLINETNTSLKVLMEMYNDIPSDKLILKLLEMLSAVTDANSLMLQTIQDLTEEVEVLSKQLSSSTLSLSSAIRAGSEATLNLSNEFDDKIMDLRQSTEHSFRSVRNALNFNNDTTCKCTTDCGEANPAIEQE